MKTIKDYIIEKLKINKNTKFKLKENEVETTVEKLIFWFFHVKNIDEITNSAGEDVFQNEFKSWQEVKDYFEKYKDEKLVISIGETTTESGSSWTTIYFKWPDIDLKDDIEWLSLDNKDQIKKNLSL